MTELQLSYVRSIAKFVGGILVSKGRYRCKRRGLADGDCRSAHRRRYHGVRPMAIASYARVALAALLLSGCAHGPELTVLVGPKRIESDRQELGATLMLIQRFGEHGACGYVHGSDPGHGKPFNSEEEMTFDSVGCGARWGGK